MTEVRSFPPSHAPRPAVPDNAHITSGEEGMNKTLRVSRKDLYDQVWSKPLIHLAKEYQLSDVGLAKICRRHNIPVPPVGYWAKLAHGHAVAKTPLPAATKNEDELIELVVKEPSPLQQLAAEVSIEDQIRNAIGHEFVRLKEFKKALHPLAIETQKEFREHIKSSRNIPDGDRIYIHNLSVTRSSLERALSLMNMLFQIIEANRIPITRKPGYNTRTFAKVLGVDVQVEIKERTKRSDNPDSKAYNKFIFRPTGLLYFELTNIYVDGARKTWSDTANTKLEEIVDDVASGIVIAAILDKRRDEEREKERKRQDEERVRRQRLEEEKRKEQERVDALFRDAEDWRKCSNLHSYVNAMGRNMRRSL